MVKHFRRRGGRGGDRISISLNAIIGTLGDAEDYPPHRARKRPPGAAGPQEFDYPGDA